MNFTQIITNACAARSVQCTQVEIDSRTNNNILKKLTFSCCLDYSYWITGELLDFDDPEKSLVKIVSTEVEKYIRKEQEVRSEILTRKLYEV